MIKQMKQLFCAVLIIVVVLTAFGITFSPVQATTVCTLKDSYSDNTSYGGYLHYGAIYQMAQQFTATSSYTLTRVTIPLKVDYVSHYEHQIICKIVTFTIGSTSTTELATSTTTLYTKNLTTSYANYNFDFAGVSITSGNVYAIYLYVSFPYDEETLWWQGNPGGTYTGGSSCYKNNNYPYTWVVFNTNSDCSFQIYECSDYYAPTVTTSAVTSITGTTATGNGNVTSDGGSTITSRGTCISTSANPTVSDHTDNTTGTTGEFTTSITGLTKNTTYHVRAFAVNAYGTSYGSDVTFTTLTDPAISSLPASSISSTTARLNASVTSGGNTSCTVKFVYKSGTGYANYSAILSAGGTEVTATGTYTTGNLPYVDITGLLSSTTYSFAVKITNTVSTQYGSVVRSFTTESGIYCPTTLSVIPSATTASAVWSKGTGSVYTLLRYSTTSYPASVTDGTLAYLGLGNSVVVSGLDPGRTYYWSIWGMTEGVYSSSYTTAICTTLAYETQNAENITIEKPSGNDMWLLTPDTTKVEGLFFSGLIENIHDTYKMPLNIAWYFVWIVIGVGGGIVLYNRVGLGGQPSYNLPMTFAAELIWFGLGSVLGLTMLWIVVILLVTALGFIVFGHRH